MLLQIGCYKHKASGFSLIEALIVFVIIGVICESGFSLYTGVTTSYNLRTNTDKLTAFFETSKQCAATYNKSLHISLSNGILNVIEFPSLYLRLAEIHKEYSFTNLCVTPKGSFILREQVINQITFPLHLASHQIASITVKL